MKLFQKILLLAIVMMFANCDRIDCWGGTQESKDKEYKGKADAFAAYHDVNKKLWVVYAKETKSFFATVTVWLHNPTSYPQKTNVMCKLVRTSAGAPGVTEEHTGGKNTRYGVTVKPKSSKEVKLQFNLSFSPINHGYVPECETSFVLP